MRRIVVVLAGALVGTALAVPSAAVDQANLTGRVVDASGTPLDGVKVTPWYDLGGGRLVELSSYYTNAEGRFVVGDDLTDSTVRLRFVDELGRGLTEFYDDAADLASATDIRLATEDLDLGTIELAPGSHITGRLTGEDGAPLLRGVVTAFSGTPGAWTGVRTAETDADGRYDIGGLAAGSYRLRFRDYSGDRLEEVYVDAPTLDEGTDVVVGVDDTAEHIDAVLTTGSTVVGQVVDGDGTPAEGVSVLAWAKVDGSWQRVPGGRDETGANGWYVIYDLAAGPHVLELRDDVGDVWLPEFYRDSPDLARATPVDVPAGGQLAVPQAVVTRAARVQGTVTDPLGDPAQSVVTAYQRVGDAWVQTARDTTDYAGRYDLRGLTAGSYAVEFAADDAALASEFYPDASSLSDATLITLAEAEQREGLDAQLAARPFTASAAPDRLGSAPARTAPSATSTIAP